MGSAVEDEEHGWYWSPATGTIDLRDRIPSCLENSASAINASGTVAGTFCNPSVLWLRAFTWRSSAAARDLGIVGEDIGNANVVGLGINDAGTEAG